MPTAWRSSSASARSSSTPTATSTGSGTTRTIRRARCRAFYKKDELELLIQRRQHADQPGAAEINEAIVERYYQTRAIRRIGEAFEKDHDRKALVVMATGAGKTRTVIALCDLLMRCNWVKRVLFLADRVALVNQAVNAFKKHLPAASPVNCWSTEKDRRRARATSPLIRR